MQVITLSVNTSQETTRLATCADLADPETSCFYPPRPEAEKPKNAESGAISGNSTPQVEFPGSGNSNRLVSSFLVNVDGYKAVKRVS